MPEDLLEAARQHIKDRLHDALMQGSRRIGRGRDAFEYVLKEAWNERRRDGTPENEESDLRLLFSLPPEEVPEELRAHGTLSQLFSEVLQGKDSHRLGLDAAYDKDGFTGMYDYHGVLDHEHGRIVFLIKEHLLTEYLRGVGLQKEQEKAVNKPGGEGGQDSPFGETELHSVSKSGTPNPEIGK